MDLNEMEPGSPEYEAEVDRLQAEEDAALGTIVEGADTSAGETTDETDPDATPAAEGAAADAADPNAAAATADVDAAAAATAAAAAAPGADQTPPTTKVAGVLGKDGKTVLPYVALQVARQTAQKANQRADAAAAQLAAANQQIEDLKAGKKPEPEDPDALTAEELEDLKADQPAVYKAYMAIQAAKPAKPAADEPVAKDEASTDDPTQDAIDSVPLLSEWQASDEEKWGRAVAHDLVLRASPKWKDKPLAERFAHVTKLVADEFDISIEDTAPPTTNTPQASKRDPKEVIAAAKRAEPNTLSDFKGGSAASQSETNISKMAPQRMLGKFLEMTPDQVEAQLANED